MVFQRVRGFAAADAVMTLVILLLLVSVAAALCRDLVSSDPAGVQKSSPEALTEPGTGAAF